MHTRPGRVEWPTSGIQHIPEPEVLPNHVARRRILADVHLQQYYGVMVGDATAIALDRLTKRWGSVFVGLFC